MAFDPIGITIGPSQGSTVWRRVRSPLTTQDRAAAVERQDVVDGTASMAASVRATRTNGKQTPKRTRIVLRSSALSAANGLGSAAIVQHFRRRGRFAIDTRLAHEYSQL